MSQISTKPYLVRAIYEWCVDQGFTPHIAVLVDERVIAPPGYARDGQIVLNLGPEATNKLAMGNDFITFQARFGGVSHALTVPVSNVIAVYARENGQGMAFELDGDDMDAPNESSLSNGEAAADTASGPEDDDPGGNTPPSSKGGHLKVVK